MYHLRIRTPQHIYSYTQGLIRPIKKNLSLRGGIFILSQYISLITELYRRHFINTVAIRWNIIDRTLGCFCQQLHLQLHLKIQWK